MVGRVFVPFLFPYFTQSLMRRAHRSESIGAFFKVNLEDRFQSESFLGIGTLLPNFWGKMAEEGSSPARVQDHLRLRYRTLKRQIHDHLGYLGEIYMAQILWQSQNKTLPGRYFHSDQDIEVNWHFSYIHHRVRLGAAKDMEVDVYAAAGAEVWLCVSNWWRGRKAGVPEVESLLAKVRMVRSERGEGLKILRLWFLPMRGLQMKLKP